MPCAAHRDLDIYVVIRKLDTAGTAMFALNVLWSSIPPENATDLLLYMGPVGMLRASHREIDDRRSMHSNYPFHPHATVQPVREGEVVKLEIGIFAMSVEFEAGEAVQVCVSGQTLQIHSFEALKGALGIVDNQGVHLGGARAQVMSPCCLRDWVGSTLYA